MATYFVASGGSNTAPYDTWAKAATSLQTALTAASTAGDTVVIQYDAVPSTDSALAADTTYTLAAHIRIISASNDGGSAYTYTAMGAANFIGHSSSNRYIIISGAYNCAVYGVTFLISGTLQDSMSLAYVDYQSMYYEGCLFKIANTHASSVIWLNSQNQQNSSTYIRNCTFSFGNSGQELNINGGKAFVEGCTIDSGGTATSSLINIQASNSAEGQSVTFLGCDFSHMAASSTLVAGDSATPTVVTFSQCRLSANVTTMLASQTTNTGMSGTEVFIYDCHSGDTHTILEYYNSFGSCAYEETIKFTSGAAGQSWKITTTSLCSRANVFRTPFIDLYHTDTSEITPYIEILRNNDSTSAYTDAEVWAEFTAKVSTGYTNSTFYSDRCSPSAPGTAQANGAGLGSWESESGSCWSGKCDSGTPLTPAENGHIRGRICVAATISGTLYVDPQIRT